MPSIKVDRDVWGVLQAEAEPFVDDPNAVLRRLLGLDEGRSPRHPADRSGVTRQRADRAPLGSLLPESEYEIPILRALAERGGSAPTRAVIAAVGERVGDRLTELDREELKSGGLRWENRVQFTRLALKQRGLLEGNSRRGTWQLTEKGWDAAERGKVE